MPTLNADFLQAALQGYDLQRKELEVTIALIKKQLGRVPFENRRRMSAAARKRIGDAARRRWARYRKAKAA